MIERSFGALLEQRCEEPGLWWIEGYRVKRRRSKTGTVSWWISDTDENGDGVHRLFVPTLGQARDWIRREINR